MASSRLSSLQEELLLAFFDREQGYFLTGGAALAGFYLKHRGTADLDLFGPPEASITEGTRALRSAAFALGAELSSIQESVDFRRFAARRGPELTVVDLVIDRAPQAFPEKVRLGTVRLDPPLEIAANKLCTLLDRMEPRDLVDLRLLLSTGITLTEALQTASVKHAGADPATLAWVLESFVIPAAHPVLAETGTAAEDLDCFRRELIDGLLRLALPPPQN